VTQPSRRAGFTLLELMGVVALISVVFFVALNFYVDLSRASTRASNHTRDIRRATAILDRVARDIEGAFLIEKPPEVDPVAFPWLFYAETRLGGDASDRLKFISRNHDPTRTDSAETNLAVVALLAESSPDDSISLYRWSSPRLPERLDKSFPREDDEGSHLLAEGLYSFGMTFFGEDGEPLRDWDSSTLLESSALPVAVEIALSMMPARGEEELQPTVYRRKVLIPVRPLDLVALADPNNPLAGGEEDEAEQEEDGEEDGEDDAESGSGGREDDDRETAMTNGKCFPRSIPDSAPMFAKMCVGLANSAPDMPFTPQDYAALPADCQAIVNPQCR
jgi:type II secretory pathway component PulJ